MCQAPWSFPTWSPESREAKDTEDNLSDHVLGAMMEMYQGYHGPTEERCLSWGGAGK